MNLAGMKTLESAFQDMGLRWISSAGNFISVDFGRDARSIYEALLRKGVIVRPVANYDMPTFLRVTIGTDAENSRFIQALGQCL